MCTSFNFYESSNVSGIKDVRGAVLVLDPKIRLARSVCVLLRFRLPGGGDLI